MVTDVQFAQIGTSKNLLSKESPTDPGRSQANSLETPLAAVWKRGLQNQRKRNKLLKAIWTNLPLKAWLSPTINQISHGFIWLSLENLQGPRVHNSSKKCIPVLYCPPTEEIPVSISQDENCGPCPQICSEFPHFTVSSQFVLLHEVILLQVPGFTHLTECLKVQSTGVWRSLWTEALLFRVLITSLSLASCTGF